MKQTNQEKQKYQQMVNELSPDSHLLMDCIKAFIIGGLICCLGQFFLNTLGSWGVSKDDSGIINAITLVFLGSLFTGFGVYDKLGKFAGAGSVVPITGFANSITAPAIEFRPEGLIFGVGAKMFAIAGPVLVYGTLTSFVVGLFYYFMK